MSEVRKGKFGLPWRAVKPPPGGSDVEIVDYAGNTLLYLDGRAPAEALLLAEFICKCVNALDGRDPEKMEQVLRDYRQLLGDVGALGDGVDETEASKTLRAFAPDLFEEDDNV